MLSLSPGKISPVTTTKSILVDAHPTHFMVSVLLFLLEPVQLNSHGTRSLQQTVSRDENLKKSEYVMCKG